jgi:hypothetical protein
MAIRDKLVVNYVVPYNGATLMKQIRHRRGEQERASPWRRLQFNSSI